MSIDWVPSGVPNLLVAEPIRVSDCRGSFTKLLSGPLGDQRPFQLDELYWSRSVEGVIRGLHVQMPPKSGRKIIFVTEGTVRDFVLDLRIGSPWFGKVWETQLTPTSGAVLIPEGCAHGFEVLEGEATMAYLQEETFDASIYSGVLWSSAGIEAVSLSPIVTEKDASLPRLDSFESPFRWEPA